MRLQGGKWILLFAVGTILWAADLGTGVTQYQQGKFTEAEATLRAYVGEHPDDADANYYLGATLVELKKYQDAEAFLQKAGDKPEAKTELAHAYLMQNRLDDAMNLLSASGDDSSKAHQYRGMILLKQNKFNEAAAELSQATQRDSKNAYAHYYLGMAQSKLNRPDQMSKEFEMFLQLAPNAPEAQQTRSLMKTR